MVRSLYLLLVLATALALSTPALAADKTVTARLHEENNSGLEGTATLKDNGDGSTTVMIRLQGDKRGSSHPAHLHEGVCTGTVPTVRYPLNNVVNGRSTTRVEASLEDLMGESLYINIHPSKDKLQPVLVCGGISEPGNLPDTGGGALSGSGVSLWLALALAVLAAGAIPLSRMRR